MSRFKSASIAALFLWSMQIAATAQEAHVVRHADVQRSAQHELDRIRQYQQQLKTRQQAYQPEQAPSYQQFQGQVCLDYDRVVLVGVTRVDISHLLPRDGECLNADRLNQLSRDITTAYLQQGYVHQHFEFEPQGSLLYLRVKEGRVRTIRGQSAIVNPHMLFPGLQGDVLNIRRLDQGLDHTNKFVSNQVTVDVLPQESGDVDLVFSNQSTGRAGAYISLDNSGNRGTGRWVARAGLMIDSPFSLSDSLMLSASHSIKNRDLDPYTRSLAFQYSVPYGYWDFSLFGSISQYRYTLRLNLNQYQLDGRTWQGGVRANYVFSRGANYVSSVYGQLERIAVRSRFEKSIIDLQSPVMMNAQLGWSHLQVVPSGIIASDIAFEQGLPWTHGYGNEYPGRYKKINLNLTAQFVHHSARTGWRHEHELIAQYSADVLPAIKQLELLDRYAVRGFERYSASAEKGAVLRNNFYLTAQRGAWRIEPYVGFDIGVQRSARAAGSGTAWGRSWSVGLKLNHHAGTEARIEYSKGRFNENKMSLSDHMFSLKLLHWF